MNAWLMEQMSCAFMHEHLWSSGYDVSLTRWRSPVRSWPGVFVVLLRGGCACKQQYEVMMLSCVGSAWVVRLRQLGARALLVVYQPWAMPFLASALLFL